MDKRPIIFGEVLFDQFPDGSSVIGGAPFNVAWHLQGLGLQPLLISAIGNDPLGQQVLATMGRWHMDNRYVQTVADAPTGRVSVSLQDGQPEFEIVDHQAYDYIGPVANDIGDLDSFALIYHGSLALRHEQSRSALQSWLHRTGLPSFTDINLRAPWWQRKTIEALLQHARWVKLNEHELAAVCGESSLPPEQWQARARKLVERYDLDLLILTLGDQGAYSFTSEQMLRGEPVPVPQLRDTVGAGDAFAAVTILGLIRHWPAQLTLQRALEFASAVCGLQGATTTDTSFYQPFVQAWR